MKIVVAIAQIILILVFGLLGTQKVFMPIPDLIETGMWWIEDFSEWQVRTIGTLETLGMLGLILPYVIKSLPKIIVVLASGGLALTMMGAVFTHIQRGDPALSITLTSTFFVLAVIVSAYRYKQIKSGG